MKELRSDIELLVQQPYLKVLPCYEKSDINYEVGHRVISVKSGPVRGLSFIIKDIDQVKRDVTYNRVVGRKTYTQKEVDALRNKE